MPVTRRRFSATAVAAFSAVLLTGGPSVAAEEPAFPVSPLTVETGGGRFQFMVEVAETPTTLRQGLQKRTFLPPEAGMLFNFHRVQPVAMWMKDTLISLDMLFIDEQGVVVNIAENTTPLSLAAIPSKGPVLAVLEVNAGTVARLGIRPGDRVVHPIFATGRRAAPGQ